MLQTLLADRFKLAVHLTFALVVAKKGPKLGASWLMGSQPLQWSEVISPP